MLHKHCLQTVSGWSALPLEGSCALRLWKHHLHNAVATPHSNCGSVGKWPHCVRDGSMTIRLWQLCHKARIATALRSWSPSDCSSKDFTVGQHCLWDLVVVRKYGKNCGSTAFRLWRNWTWRNGRTLGFLSIEKGLFRTAHAQRTMHPLQTRLGGQGECVCGGGGGGGLLCTTNFYRAVPKWKWSRVCSRPLENYRPPLAS